MTRHTPQAVAEIVHPLPPGEDERISGWGVMGIPFESGDYLSLRCMSASFGEPYVAIWHRSPAGDWRVYSTADPALSCERFISAACTLPSVRTAIETEWLDERTLRVHVAGHLDWTIAMRTTVVTRMMSVMGRLMPHWMWISRSILGAMGRMAGPMLGVGRVRLTGTMPNGQSFTAAPVEIWAVADSRAILDGRDLGAPTPLPTQEKVGGFWVPQRGIFMRGFGHFDAFDPSRHTHPSDSTEVLTGQAS